jgi:urease accessory protein
MAQGRALLAVWDRSFKAEHSRSAITASSVAQENAPLWGLVTNILSVPLHDSAYLFLFSHARTVISAAVRASVLGPYQAQSVLASAELQSRIRGLVEEGWDRKIEDAGQSVPVMDLWVGRHEKLYSRIFNS